MEGGTRSYHFGQAFISELTEFGTSSFANIPYSAIFVTIVFMLDTAMRSSTAKLYFVCGYFINMLLFYSVGRICFPAYTESGSVGGTRSDDRPNMQGGGGSSSSESRDTHIYNMQRYLARPLQRYTDASFFNFSAGYILGYWGNLNILLNTPNANITVFYYVVFVLFCFMYSVFYLSSDKSGGACSWQSGMISAVMGVLGGMLCAQLIHPRIKLEDGVDHQMNLSASSQTNTQTNTLPQGVPQGAVQCDSKSNDMICRVFQAGG